MDIDEFPQIVENKKILASELWANIGQTAAEMNQENDAKNLDNENNDNANKDSDGFEEIS